MSSIKALWLLIRPNKRNTACGGSEIGKDVGFLPENNLRACRFGVGVCEGSEG